MATKKPSVEELRARAKQLLQASAPEIIADKTFNIPEPKVPVKPLDFKFRCWSGLKNVVLYLPGNQKITFTGHEYTTEKIEEIQYLQQMIREFPSKFKRLP